MSAATGSACSPDIDNGTPCTDMLTVVVVATAAVAAAVFHLFWSGKESTALHISVASVYFLSNQYSIVIIIFILIQ